MGSMSAMAAWHKSFSSTGPKRQCPEGRSCADPCIPANQGPCQDLLPKRTVPWKLTGHPPLSLFWFPPPRRLPGPAVESFWMVRSRGRGGGGQAVASRPGSVSHAPWASPAGSFLLWAAFLRPQGAAPRKGSSPGLCHTPTTKGPA